MPIFGYKKKEPKKTPVGPLGRTGRMNAVNYYNSGGSVGKMPTGWTKDDLNQYIQSGSPQRGK